MTPMRTFVLLMAVSLASCASTKPSLSSMPKSGFVEVPGGPVWYEVMSEGEGTPLVILHGGPGGTSCGYQRLGSSTITGRSFAMPNSAPGGQAVPMTQASGIATVSLRSWTPFAMPWASKRSIF